MDIVIDNGNVSPLITPDRWTPKLNGKVYCSPACGAKCLKVDFDLATEGANALVVQLGSGWMPHVWENFGWHFEAKKRGATVSVDSNGLYEATIRFWMDERIELCVSETRGSPREAVDAVIGGINARIATLKRALLSLSLAPLEIQDVSP